ncbi:hypothetical protein SUGI_0481730 [Cryptomeria japonica]|nr:hypothetical protein SUGI_0481730 [Cryptomeria japonica]
MVDLLRSTRTNKGDSVVGQVVSGRFVIEPLGFISRVNFHLPEQIRDSVSWTREADFQLYTVIMGFSRDSMHKRHAMGRKEKQLIKNTKYELGREIAMTKLSSNKMVRRECMRGGHVKWRGLRLDTSNFSKGSETVTRKTCILDMVHTCFDAKRLIGGCFIDPSV